MPQAIPDLFDTVTTIEQFKAALEEMPNTERHLFEEMLYSRAAAVETYRHNPARFVLDCISWKGDKKSSQPANYQLDILDRLAEHHRECVRSAHGTGKCVGLDEKILLLDGRYARAADLIGRYFGVLSFSPDGIVPSLAFAFDNGLRETYEVRTHHGHCLVRTGEHPLLTFSGWKEVKDLKVGDFVAMPTSLPVEGHRSLPIEHVKILAYLIGDGSLTGGGVQFIQQPGKNLEEFRRCVKSLGCVLRESGRYGYAVVNPKNKGIFGGNPSHENLVNALLRQYGLMGKNSYQKMIPPEIFELPNRQLAIFLSRLFSTDGWAVALDSRTGLEIGYASMSYGLVQDVQRALLRFGIVGHLRSRRTSFTYKGELKQAASISWVWCVQDAENLLRFCNLIGIYGKEDAIERVRRRSLKRDISTSNPPLYQRWPDETALYVRSAFESRALPIGMMTNVIRQRSRSKYVRMTTRKVSLAQEFLGDDWLGQLIQARVGWTEVTSVISLGENPTVGISVPGQETFVSDLIEHNTALGAWAVLWFSLTRDGFSDWKAITTASNWRQLTRYLWPEIYKWWARIKWEKLGRNPPSAREALSLTLRGYTGEAFAVASNDPDKIEGAHAESILYVFDESKAIPDPFWDAIEGAFAGSAESEVYALSISTPGEPQGRFYHIQSKKPGYEDWNTRHIKTQEAVDAGRLTPEWIDQRKRQWPGENNPIYLTRVEGEFAEFGEDTVIPLAWVNKAFDRWWALHEDNRTNWKRNVLPRLYGVGVDVARFGDDLSTIASLHGKSIIRSVICFSKQDVMKTCGEVVKKLDAVEYVKLSENGDENLPPVTVVDAIGDGAGVVDRLRELKYTCVGFTAGARAELPGGAKATDHSKEIHFLNMRAWAWWNLRERLDPTGEDPIALPPDEMIQIPPGFNHTLSGDLTAPKWKTTSTGALQIEGKDEIKKRIGRSTDLGDAVAMVMLLPMIRSASAAAWIKGMEQQVKKPTEETVPGMPSDQELYEKLQTGRYR